MMRIAVLVDGDNVPPVHAGFILATAQTLGRVDIAHVYVNGASVSDWLLAPGYRGFYSSPGKNSSDLLLSIDAMEMSLTGGVDGFVLVSSDGGFIHLAQRLRAHGRRVHGLGESKTPETFRKACETFRHLTPPARTTVAAAPSGDRLDREACNLIAQSDPTTHKMLLVRFGSEMTRTTGVKGKQAPGGTWRKFVEARSTLFKTEGKGNQTRVCLLRGN